VSRFRITPAAVGDLRAIRDYIAQDSPQAAIRVLQELRRSFALIAQHPGVGHQRDDLANPLRRIVRVYSYLVIYSAKTKPITILRVIHGARDLSRIQIDDL
jgi:plasmid stabilization system protein ParE